MTAKQNPKRLSQKHAVTRRRVQERKASVISDVSKAGSNRSGMGTEEGRTCGLASVMTGLSAVSIPNQFRNVEAVDVAEIPVPFVDSHTRDK